MLDPSPAHVKLVERDDILREVVTDGIISPKLPGNGFLRCKEVRHLNIQLLSALVAHEVDPFVSGPANGHIKASSQQFQIDNVLENQVDVLCVKWLGDKKQLSHRDVLRAAIDDALARKPKTFEELIRLVRESGYRVSEGKSVTFYKPMQKGIKLHTLGAGYSEAELRAVIEGKAAHNPRGKRERVNLLIDIEARLAAGKGGGYAQWAKVFNVKQMAKTLLYLQEHGIKGREELNARADAASEKLAAVNERIKAIDAQIKEFAELRGQIVTYAKTRKIFDEYKAAHYSRKFYDAHEDAIEQHRAAKRYFTEHCFGKLPKVKDINELFDKLVAEKRAAYAEYRAIRDEHRELLVHRHNVEVFLGEEKPAASYQDRGER